MKETKTNIKEKINEKINKIKRTKEYVLIIKNKIKSNLKNRENIKINKQNVKYYSVLLLMIIMAVVTTYLNIKEYGKATQSDFTQYTLNKKEVEVNSNNVKIEKEDIPQYITSESSISTNNSSDKMLPVKGTVCVEYSMDKVVYNEDLEIWKTHSGVDIACDENAAVYCIVEGKVVGIYTDAVYGNSVVVEGEKYTTVYSSLKEVEVNIGNKLKKGDRIGCAGNCAGEKSVGTHIHFELMENEEYINPSIIGIK